jgi:hypothetical protein
VVYDEKAASPRQRLRVLIEGMAKPATATLRCKGEGEREDLAVLELRTAVKDLMPPQWDHPALAAREVRVTGYPANQPYNRERMVNTADQFRVILHGDVIPGISGGAVLFTDERWQPDWCCVGILTRTARLSASEAIAVPVIEEFLERNALELPRQGPKHSPRPSARARDTKKYLAYVRSQTGQIDLASLGNAATGGRLPVEVEIDRPRPYHARGRRAQNAPPNRG